MQFAVTTGLGISWPRATTTVASMAWLDARDGTSMMME
jgi:hypothetical protein